MTDSPLISCLMVTRGHLVRSRFAIDRWQRQIRQPGEHCYPIRGGNSWDEAHFERRVQPRDAPLRR